QHVATFGGRLKPFLERLIDGTSAGYEDHVVVSQQTARLAELAAEEGGRPIVTDVVHEHHLGTGQPVLVQGSADGGFEAPTLGLVLYTDVEIFGWAKPRRQVRRRRAAVRESFLTELEPGDWIVHVDHGVGRYRGLVRQGQGDDEREYLLLEYAEQDRLY